MRKYVDLMADADWSAADLERLGASYVASEFPDAQTLAEKAQAVSLGYGLMTAEEQARSRALFDFRQTVRLEVEAAKGDAALLLQVKALEAAQLRLQRALMVPELDVDGVTVLNQEALDLDAQQRLDAQALIDAAPPDVAALVAQRNRVPPPEPPAPQEPIP